MAADESNDRGFLRKDRLEAFSDGVFSIAATLLVLEITFEPSGTALQKLLHAWPSYLAYAVSFLTIGAAWLVHSGITERLSRADGLLLRINLLLLLVVAFLPFPTKLVAEALHDTSSERVYVTLYGLVLFAIRGLGSALDGYARHVRLYADEQGNTELEVDRRKFLPVAIGYAVTILVGLAVPELAVALYFAVAVFLVVPFHQLARALFARR